MKIPRCSRSRLLCGASGASARPESLREIEIALRLADTVFTTVELVPPDRTRRPHQRRRRGGAAAAAAAGRGAARRRTRRGAPAMLPAYCRVAATLKPSSDSDIKMESGPARENWNGKFEMLGNGGWAGVNPRLCGECNRLSAKATRRRPPTPATKAATECSRWVIPKRSPTSPIARCTRRW